MRVLNQTLAIVLTVVFSMSALAAEQAPPEGVRTFTYKRTEQAELKIHVHFPADWTKGDQRPGIVFFFGGGWNSGSVNQFIPQAEYLAKRGMVAARADYRVRSRHKVTPEKCVEDAKSAVRWFRRNAKRLGIDPQRIVASGGSAGGHLAACTGCTPGPETEGEDLKISSKPNVMLLFNPVLNLTLGERLLGRLDGDEKLGKLISPTLHLEKNTPPALILFGTKDRLLPHGEEFIAHSKQVGNRAEIYLAKGQGHGFFNRSPWLERTLRRSDEFLSSLGYLKGKPTIEAP